MFLPVNLRPTGRKLPSLGVYRSVNGIIGLYLGVSWIPYNQGGPQNVNDLFIQSYTPLKTLVRWIRLKKILS